MVLGSITRAFVHSAVTGRDSEVHVNVELIRFAAERLHVSVHIVAFREAGSRSPPTPWMKGIGAAGNGMPSVVGLTDREAKIIDYLWRAIGSTPAVSLSGSGAVAWGTRCSHSGPRSTTPASCRTPRHAPLPS